MMKDEPGPLVPELDEFLDAERRYPDAPAHVRGRVLARVQATIGAPGAPAPALAAPTTAFLARPALVALGIFVLGVVIAVGVVRRKRVDGVQEPAMRSAPLVVREPRPSAPEPVRAAEAITRPEEPLAPRSRTSRPAPVEDELEAERIMLQRARADLAQGDGRAALEMIARHAREFERGTLAEEREALAVKALISIGSHQAARARGAEFRRRHPRSIYLPAVEQALETIP